MQSWFELEDSTPWLSDATLEQDQADATSIAKVAIDPPLNCEEPDEYLEKSETGRNIFARYDQAKER
jgi:hypothetical protein